MASSGARLLWKEEILRFSRRRGKETENRKSFRQRIIRSISNSDGNSEYSKYCMHLIWDWTQLQFLNFVPSLFIHKIQKTSSINSVIRLLLLLFVLLFLIYPAAGRNVQFGFSFPKNLQVSSEKTKFVNLSAKFFIGYQWNFFRNRWSKTRIKELRNTCQ